MIAGLVGTAVGLAVVAVAHDLWVLLVGLALPGGALGLVFATTTALISLTAGDREQGAVLGLTASIGSAARIAGPLVGVAALPARGHRRPADPRGRAVRGLRGRRDTGQDQSVASRGGVTRVCITTQ